jgi:hypothetical protein
MMSVHTKSLPAAQPFSFDIDERTRRLELIANWRDALRDKLSGQWDQSSEFDPFALEPDELRSEIELYKLAAKAARA